LIFSQPDAVAFVDAVFPLPNNAFQIVVANFLKRPLALSFDVLDVNDELTDAVSVETANFAIQNRVLDRSLPNDSFNVLNDFSNLRCG
jgi:hypothetical protein